MEKKKWKPQRDQEILEIWAKWFWKNKPICHPQRLWNISLWPTVFLDDFYKAYGEGLRQKKILRGDIEECLKKILKACNIYPYKQAEEAFMKEFNAHFIELLQRKYIIEEVPFCHEEESEDGEKVITYEEPPEIDDEIENKWINDIEPDLKELRKKNCSIREIEEKTGMSKSTVQRKLSKK